MSTKKPASAADRRSQQAIDLFEKAMKALGKRDYDKAREHFDALIASPPDERDLLERARAYRPLCERAWTKRPAFRPKTFEELLHHGVFLHNRGEFEEALKFLRQAAEIHPQNEHVLYCLAATSARAGDTADRAQGAALGRSTLEPRQPRPGPQRLRLRRPPRATRSSSRSSTRRRPDRRGCRTRARSRVRIARTAC